MPDVWGKAALPCLLAVWTVCMSVSSESERWRLLTGCDLIQRLTKKKENILFIWNKLVSQLISFNVK